MTSVLRRIVLVAIILLTPVGVINAQNIELPKPPSELRNVPERAGWLVTHYWDKADLVVLAEEYQKTPKDATSILEQSFVNYISLFPITENIAVCRDAVGELLARADESSQVINILCDFSEKYLYNVESPMVNDEYFLCFIEGSQKCRNVSAEWKMDCLSRKRALTSNMAGSRVCEFTFETLCGSILKFSDIHGQRLLVLYDITCSDCMETISKLKSSQMSDITIVAIALNATRDDFRKFAEGLPSEWICGFDSTKMINGGSFILRNFPEIYQVSSDGIVISKRYTL